MALHPADLMDPEEAVGNLWHGLTRRLVPVAGHSTEAVALEAMRPSLAVMFRALGGASGVEIAASPATASRHRRGLCAQLGDALVMEHASAFDGTTLRLPPVMDAFPTLDLNRVAYLWLAALAACTHPARLPDDPLVADLIWLESMHQATTRALDLCPGLRAPHAAMCAHLLKAQPLTASPAERAVADAARGLLSGLPPDLTAPPAPRGYAALAPQPVWLRLEAPATGVSPATDEDPISAPSGLVNPRRKKASRQDNAAANRTDSFIFHRFESILSWVESLMLNRATDDDDLENAKKAAEDHDHITLSPHYKRAATRLRLHLDLAPQDADHERLSARFTYPEWNHRSQSYMPDHCVVLEAEATPGASFTPDPRLMARVKRQFQALHPRRIQLSRQIEGTDLDLDALIDARVQVRATGQGSDRIYRSLRCIERDLAVAILMDCSRSTESVVGTRGIIDTMREALVALAGGIDAGGDRLAIWGFSSLRRDRIFLTRCKGFKDAMSPAVTAHIGGLRPGHYTRLGAAIRHVSAQLAEAHAARKLLLVLTDGKPNDLDHYEGRHGIEDSRMAVREARALGQSLHGVIVDTDGQSWFARIFGRAGFTLLPDPARLGRALPDIYRALIQEP